jgi:hypothetical protein
MAQPRGVESLLLNLESAIWNLQWVGWSLAASGRASHGFDRTVTVATI